VFLDALRLCTVGSGQGPTEPFSAASQGGAIGRSRKSTAKSVHFEEIAAGVAMGAEYTLRQPRPNVVYYFEIGAGHWAGTFRFAITSWRQFWSDPVGVRNRFLALSMHAVLWLLGPASITSRLGGSPDAGAAGIATNLVRITKLGITLYLLSEQYVLDPDGRNVEVISQERFGPIPFLFNDHKTQPAEITDDGMKAVYHIPLLDAQWLATYTVRADRRHIDSTLVSRWGEADESIDKLAEIASAV
jgi:hypothetical protein